MIRLIPLSNTNIVLNSVKSLENNIQSCKIRHQNISGLAAAEGSDYTRSLELVNDASSTGISYLD